jgi:Flp pilus assembly protein TadG
MMTCLNRLVRRLRQQRGVALVEFALTLPVFALLLVGILEFGVVMFQMNNVTEASRDGTRQAAVNANGPNNVCSASNNWLGAACTIAPTGSKVCISAPDGNTNIGSRIKITVDYPYTWVTALAAAATGQASINLHGENTMRLEQAGTNLPAGITSGPICVTT